jgi:hypothetical protein
MLVHPRRHPIALLACSLVLLLTVLWIAPSASQTVNADLWETNGSVNAIARSGNTIYIGGEFSTLGRRTGQGVTLSQRSGAILGPVSVVDEVNAVVYAAIPDGAGGWYVGGRFGTVGGEAHANIAHILADGSVAPWRPSVRGWEVRCLALHGHTLYVGGEFSAVNGRPRGNLAAVDARTGELTVWDPSPVGGVFGLFVKGHTVYACGDFDVIGGQVRHHIAALDAKDGTATAWNPDANFSVFSIAPKADTCYAGGYFTRMGGQERLCFAALDLKTGAVLPWAPKAASHEGWNPQYGTWPGVFALTVCDSTVYAGGYFDTVDGMPRSSVVALDARTGAVKPWNITLRRGYMGYWQPMVLALAANRSAVYVGGVFDGQDVVAPRNLATVDPVSGAAIGLGLGTDLGVAALALTDSTLYVGGAFRRVEVLRPCLAALDATLGIPTPWAPKLGGRKVNALLVWESRVFVGGEFYAFSGVPRANLAALDADTGVLMDFYAPANGEVRALALDGYTLYAAGTFTRIGYPYQARNHIAALFAYGGTPYGWDANADGEVDALSSDGTTLHAGGLFTRIGGQARRSIAALDLATGVATGWAPEANGRVACLVTSGRTICAGGDFDSIGGRPRRSVAALDSATGIATSWDPGADGTVDAMVVGEGVVIAGGAFHTFGGQSRSWLAAVDPVTARPVEWSPEADGEVRALALTDSMVFVGGLFRFMGGASHRGIAEISAPVWSLAATARVSPSEGESATLALAPAPNPVRSTGVIRFTLPVSGSVSLAVFDIQGRCVEPLLDHVSLAAGEHEMRLSTDGWQPGLYFCRLGVGDETATRKLLVVR